MRIRTRSSKIRTCLSIESGVRHIQRCENGLTAARENVAARTELVCIIDNQVKVKTATEATLKDAQAQLADAKAQFFDAQLCRVVSHAELIRTQGRK